MDTRVLEHCKQPQLWEGSREFTLTTRQTTGKQSPLSLVQAYFFPTLSKPLQARQTNRSMSLAAGMLALFRDFESSLLGSWGMHMERKWGYGLACTFKTSHSKIAVLRVFQTRLTFATLSDRYCFSQPLQNRKEISNLQIKYWRTEVCFEDWTRPKIQPGKRLQIST